MIAFQLPQGKETAKHYLHLSLNDSTLMPINLIIGPSSSGKSTYIASTFTANVAVYMAYELMKAWTIQSPCVIHYNSFRPYDNNAKNLSNSFDSDPVLAKIFESGEKLNAVLLVCASSILIKRMTQRAYTEPLLRSNFTSYPKSDLIDLLEKIDLEAHYVSWYQLLRDHETSVSIVDSNNGFQSRFGLDAIKSILRTENTRITGSSF